MRRKLKNEDIILEEDFKAQVRIEKQRMKGGKYKFHSYA